MATAKYTDFTLYRRLLRQARPYWPQIVGISLLSLLSSPLALLYPLPLKIVVDNVLGSDPLPRFLVAILPPVVTGSNAAVLILAVSLFVIFALLGQLMDLASSLLRANTGEKMVLGFKARLFRHIQRLSLSYHDSKGTADSIYRIQYDAPSIQYIMIDGIIPFVTSTLTLVLMIYVTSRIDRQLAIVALTITPVLILLLRSYRKQLRSRSGEVKRLETTALSVVQEVLAAVRVVKAFAQEEREEDRFVNRSSEGMWARIRLTLVEGTFGLLIGLTTAIGTAIVLFIGIRHVQSGVITLGDLLLIMGYLSQLYEPLKTISRKIVSLQSHLASAERAFSVLDEPTEVPERAHARRLSHASGAVSFCDVSFAYEHDRPVLRDISFDIAPGNHVGIMGMTGAGKTTLLSLLMRFYDPISGQILLDGVDLRDYKLNDLRNQFAIVLQEPVLFSTGIAENIAYARPEASDEEIIEAAKAANAHEFIIRLPQGYETQVGERGMRLSGGERQRISLARAFLKNAPILILDEPTSSVDLRTEAVIIEALERLMHGRTTFMIAHRSSTVANCDMRLEIEGGRLVNAIPPALEAPPPTFWETGTTLQGSKVDA